jgi:hypothetical protein
MLAMLLPFLGVTALQMQAPLSEAEIEQALVDGVREKLAKGWTVVDVRGDYDELAITLAKNGKVEQHVAHMDDEAGNAIRIDAGGPLPAHPIGVTDFLVLALSDRFGTGGGIEIGGDCGRIEARPYLLDASAKGADARRLVATTLKASDDVESAYVEGNLATFSIDTAGKHAELRVTLDDNGKVTAAQVRRYDFGPDMSTHAKQSTMKDRIGDQVTKIVDGTFGPKLYGDKRFTFDSNAFESHHTDDGSCGC